MTMRRASAILLTLFLAGCGFFSRPKNTFYSLETLGPDTPLAASARNVPVGIDGVELPPGLDQRGIVLRGADHKVEVRGTHQWTSSLEEMVIHTLSFDLAKRLPQGMVILPGQAKPAAMRSVYVTLEELAPGPEPVFVLDARWNVIETGRPESTGHQRITIPMESMESPAVVAAMSRALASLADRLAAELAR